MKKYQKILLLSTLALGNVAQIVQAQDEENQTSNPSPTATEVSLADESSVANELSSSSLENQVSQVSSAALEGASASEAPLETPVSQTSSSSESGASSSETSQTTVAELQSSSSQTTELVRKRGKVEIQAVNPQTGTFEVVVSEVANPAGVTEVLVPVWGAYQGQNDIKWYVAKQDADGTFRVTVASADHRGESGTYHAHLYYRQADGSLTGVTSTSTQLNLTKPSGDLVIENQNDGAGTFDVVARNINAAKGVQTVLIPVWSESGGQDDIQWYQALRQADGSYRATVKIANHKYSSGIYHAHLYVRQNDDSLTGLKTTQTSVTVQAPKGQLTIQNKNSQTGSFDVTISNIQAQGDIKTIYVPVWSETAGQDDIQWYVATRQANGSYKVSVNIAKHGYSTGKYHIHLYYQDSQGYLQGVASTTTDVQAALPSAQVTISASDSQGRFDVTVSNLRAPLGVKSIKVPVWSEAGGQDDIRWHEATRQADGSFKASISYSQHGYETGRYAVHVYALQGNDQLVGLAATSQAVTAAAAQISTSYAGTGGYQVTINQVHGDANVLYAVWSDTASQDDIKWYQATKTKEGQYIGRFNVQDHAGTGTYHIHAYRNLNGRMSLLGTGHVQVAKQDFSAPYYYQRDSRWKSKKYGISNLGLSGCVPTVLSMAISGITGQDVKPTDVAEYLYHNTTDFNRTNAGTYNRGLHKAAKNWGLTTRGIYSAQALQTALQEGYYVTAAVQSSVFVKAPGTHEILLKGYKDGKTYVYDPDNPKNNGWHSISYIYGVKSTYILDNTNGTPIHLITD